jgi:predicted GIY-YIG superfamily endonuclease
MARSSKYGINIKDSGVYLIKNLYNGKVYIGSAKCLISRLSSHRFLLNNNKYHSRHL